MDFFAQQDTARRHTTLLVFLFLLAVAAIVLSVNAVSSLMYAGIAPQIGGAAAAKPPAGFHLWVSLATLAIIGVGSLVEFIGVASGGPAVAQMMGARRVLPSSADLGERRLLNVVEEMSIAAGVTVPQVFVMDEQGSINAFAAGFSANEAAVVVTRGTLQALNRDELQGVIGHEFSHILNGDMRLNMRLLGVLGGILVIATLGRIVVDATARGDRTKSIVLFGVALIAIGYIGVFFGRLIQAGVSRQREFLADASSVQFTRNRDGIGGALAKIGQGSARIEHPRAEEASHMFFGEAIESKLAGLMATHPPIEERLARVYGGPVLISDIVGRSAPAESAAPELPEGAAVMGFAGGNDFGRSANGRRIDAADATRVDTGAGAFAAAVGTVTTQHVERATALLRSLPPPVRELVREPQGARQAMFGLVFALAGPVRAAQETMLAAGGEDAARVAAVAAQVQALGKAARLPLISLATPTLKVITAEERVAFLALLRNLIEADRRVTLEEFVLATLLETALGERAGRAVPVKFRSLDALSDEVRQVLSLIAHASTGAAADSFAQGAGEAGLKLELMESRALNIAAIRDALARLNQLAPLQKPRLVKAITQCALADGQLSLTEAELLRAICATLDAPLPPFVESMLHVN